MPFLCYACGNEWKEKEKPGRNDLCAKCGRPLHCCLNCEFYDINKEGKCRIPDIEIVRDKESANFCDEFVFKDRKTTSNLDYSSIKDKWNSLFKR